MPDKRTFDDLRISTFVAADSSGSGVEWAVAETKPPPIGELAMTKLVFAASLVAALVLSACGASTPPPSQPAVVPPPASPVPSIPAVPSTPEPPDPTAEPPVATPAPTVRPTPKPTPRPTAPSFSRAERYLIDGIMRGEGDCSPVRSSALPGRAIAGIDCDLDATPVARMGFYLFRNEVDMLDVYLARMEKEGIQLETGGCLNGEAENSYIPWAGDDISPYREGCFVNDDGYANYRATLPGFHVYVGLLGRTPYGTPLADWAWFGNEDTPGNPTLWQQDFVYRP